MECYEAEGLHLPMVLACGHSIYHECCPKLLQEDNAGDKRYLCPMKCDQETRIEPRRNFALLEQLEVLKGRVGAGAAPEASVCENCEEAEAVLYCAKCEGLLCDACAKTTHASKLFARHELIPASERVKAAAKQPTLCPEHDEPFKYMCLDCNVVTCVDCKEFGDHQGHRHDLIRKMAGGHREQLQAALTEVDTLNGAADATARTVEAVVQALGLRCGAAGCGEAPDSSVARAKQMLKDQFCDLHAALDERLQELNLAIDQERDQKLEQLEEQLASLGMLRSRIHMVRFQTEAALEVSTARHSCV